MPQNNPNASLRLGTRGSRLAMAQSEQVRQRLAAMGIACELVEVRTSGDRIQDRPLADAGGKGLFVKELEEALLAGRIDFAVHSMKDVPVELPPGLSLGAVLEREDPRDALIAQGRCALAELAPGARLGTASVRRRAQALRARPDLNVALLRGNVDTRLRRLEAGDFDAILLAFAGLKRLGLADRPLCLLHTEDWLPALAQGAVGIELRSDDARTRKAIEPLRHLPTEIALACERAFQAALDGSCRTPIAGLAQVHGSELHFAGEVLAPDGRDSVAHRCVQRLSSDPLAEAARLGHEAGLAVKTTAAPWLAAACG
jgi:hydroxymethylbilane synthase